MNGKVTLHCDTCGAALNREPRERLEHTWWIRLRHGEWRRGAMVGYECPNWYDGAHWSSWGKLRAIVFTVPESAVPEEVQREEGRYYA